MIQVSIVIVREFNIVTHWLWYAFQYLLLDTNIHSLGQIILFVLQVRVVGLPSQNPDLCKSYSSKITNQAFGLFNMSSMWCHPGTWHGTTCTAISKQPIMMAHCIEPMSDWYIWMPSSSRNSVISVSGWLLLLFGIGWWILINIHLYESTIFSMCLWEEIHSYSDLLLLKTYQDGRQ